jgi:hypothetical protein
MCSVKINSLCMKSSGNPHIVPLHIYTVNDHSTQSDPYLHTASSRRRVFIIAESSQGSSEEFIRATFGARNLLSLLMAKRFKMPGLKQASINATL